MEKTFEPKLREAKIYQKWEETGCFRPSGKGKAFSIVIPPPNVTGTLHMGHGFQLTLMDAITRYQRMCGKNTLWQLGTDHAGIATQLVVEGKLREEGKTRQEIGREAFLERALAWKDYSKNIICSQQRRLGISGDWEKERFTLDDGLCQAVHKVFVDLYNEGLIYRGKRLANWDPVLKTAVSDLEVNLVEQTGELWYIRYPIQDSQESLIVATTRPETMLGDMAVAVNPNDERYKKLIGKQAKLPLTERFIPIIADDYVDQNFGTGCVKITPAHDFNDYLVGQRHKLDLLNILTEDAVLNDNVPKAYRGLERFEARKKILSDLENIGLLVKTEKHINKIPIGDRSGAILEPYLTDQWFVKTKPLAEKAIRALQNGNFQFVPKNWDKTYLNWLENIEDWCISRQLWWGHRIPAWYDENGKIYVGNNEEEIRQKHNLSKNIKLKQDEDVLDTWFSSALWPFSSLGWPENTADLKTFYPTSVLVTGFDIIFFWVARMVMMGLKFMDEIPFHKVYITGLIRDSKGQKMSKSKGNILDPLDLIDGISLEGLLQKRLSSLMLASQKEEVEKATREEFPNGIQASGTDALRFTFAALATTSRDINFDISRLEGYRNFCNKLWNAARFVLLQIEGQDYGQTLSIEEYKNNLALPDQWILDSLQDLIQNIHFNFQEYRFDLIAEALHNFIWNEYCAWYLEFSKATLNSTAQNEKVKTATRRTLLEVLEKLLRLIHPLMPFISEEIWQEIAPLLSIKDSSIMIQPYPTIEEKTSSDSVVKIEWLKKVILAVRNIRGEMNIAPSKPLELLFKNATDKDRLALDEIKDYFQTLARVSKISYLSPNETAPSSAVAIVDGLEILVPLAGLIDITQETARLNKEIAKLEKDRLVLENKLKNPNFVDKAPKEVVAAEKERQEMVKNNLQKLQQQLKSFG
ncbi:MAG: valine--tRNA ligase [Gammaproteobacteria bacterium]